ncbi:MAG TPA: S1 RNA-binding domain-containing protein [Myxococcota bacterium]|nr:S1 RNA-binding domain-containing protein [Myxococcota bacterium]
MPSRLSELEAIASLGGVDMAALLDATPLQTRLPSPGARVRGKVTAMNQDELHVDLGIRATGVLSRREAPELRVGDEVQAYVVSADDLGVQLSARLSGAAAADHLEEAREGRIPVEGTVASRNAGGYEVRVGAIRAFCPASQIGRLPPLDPDSLIGATLAFLVVETDEKIVVSRRAWEERELPELRERFWASAREGDLRLATVTNVNAWGAFVDVDGVDARLPRKEFGWENVDDLTTRLSRGQRLDVRIVELDAATNRVTVSTRDPGLDPWRTIGEKLRVGEVRAGRVMGQAEYGAFVEVLPGLQGLLHASRLAGAPVPAPGVQVEVRVLAIDPNLRRIELAPRDFDPAAQAANPPGALVDGVVTEVEARGVRVRLADGRTGWLAEREVDLAPGQMLAHRFRAGFPVQARVMSEAPGGKVNLSMREDESHERDAWRAAAGQQASAGMGTLGDLLKGLRR